MTILLKSVGKYSSSEACMGLLSLVKAQGPVLDCTFGSGLFWSHQDETPGYVLLDHGVVQVVRSDKDPSRGRDMASSFLDLPFRDESFPTVVFDPPFHPSVGSAEAARFSEMGVNERDLRTMFVTGLEECWRVSGRHLLVKCQGFVHNHRPQWMELWACQTLGDPFEWLTTWRDGKRVSGRWKSVKSLRRNHATYLLFDKAGNHR